MSQQGSSSTQECVVPLASRSPYDESVENETLEAGRAGTSLFFSSGRWQSTFWIIISCCLGVVHSLFFFFLVVLIVC